MPLFNSLATSSSIRLTLLSFYVHSLAKDIVRILVISIIILRIILNSYKIARIFHLTIRLGYGWVVMLLGQKTYILGFKTKLL